MSELDKLFKRFKETTHPEDIFGDCKSASELSEAFRQFARLVHPDKFRGKVKATAEEAFKELNRLLQLAEKKLKAGTYGDKSAIVEEVKIATKTNNYTVKERIASGDIAEIYGAENKDGASVVLKVARNPVNNDLLVNESQTLAWLRTDAPSKDLKVMVHVPLLLDSFELNQAGKVKRVNVLKRQAPNYYTLSQVMDAYPDGLELADVAWMWNRLLGALLAAHQSGLVHGAVIPEHVLVCDSGSEEHNGVLVDWCYAVKKGQPLKAVVPNRKDIYPPEVFDKKPVDFGVDLYMAAKCAKMLLGNLPVHRKIDGLFKACWLTPRHRTQDVWELYSDFGAVLRELFGPRKFHKFTMPKVTK